MESMDAELNGFIELFLPRATAAQRQTAAYLRDIAPDLSARIGAAYACYQTLLILPTGLRFNRPYYPYNLPFYEAANELDSSFLLAFSGEYKAAIQHLRFVLELALLGLHFCEPMEEGEIQRWLLGEKKTPQMGGVLKGLELHARLGTLSTCLGKDLRRWSHQIYDALSGYVHTQGEAATGARMRGSNFPLLNLLALRNWAALLTDVVRAITLACIGRFPHALQGVPLFEKFGFVQTPSSGFLEPFEVPRLEAVFDNETAGKLRGFSDRYHTEEFRFHWDEIAAIHDLSLAELKTSAHEWWALMKQADQGYIPGKTRIASWATPGNSVIEEPRTPQDFVKIATYARRELNVSDELMLAHAYTHNLLRGENARCPPEV